MRAASTTGWHSLPWRLLAVQRSGTAGLGTLIVDLAGGIVIGVAVAWGVVLPTRVRFLEASSEYQPLLGFGAGLPVIALALHTGWNMFGILIQPSLFVRVGWRGYVAAVLMLVAVRPLALAVALVRAALDRREWVTEPNELSLRGSGGPGQLAGDCADVICASRQDQRASLALADGAGRPFGITNLRGSA